MSPAARHFIRHYLEMVVAMLLGMVVLGMPATWALGAMGVTMTELRTDAPALSVLGMAVTMTVPMVGWMRVRGHGWPACADMSLAMFLPAFGAIALLGAGVVEDFGTLMAIEHVAMPLTMLGAMFLRTSEYTGGAHLAVAR